MSRNLLAILLSELKTVRLICQRGNCGGVVEVAVAQLGTQDEYKCPACRNNLIDDRNLPHQQLANAIQRMESRDSTVKIEFVIPQD